MTRRPSLLLGSVNLPDRAAVFEAVSAHLAGDLRSVPDGETGDRVLWASWEAQRLARHPEVAVVDEMVFNSPVAGEFRQALMAPADGVDLTEVRFGPFSYAKEAALSYAAFTAEREKGSFGADTRFQVSVPSPMMFAMMFPAHRLQALVAFERDLTEEIARIIKAVPARDLALQWDVAGETNIQEQFYREDPTWELWKHSEKWPLEEVTESLGRVSASVPEEALLGIHFCYGDPEGEHLVQPHDLTIPVAMANSVGETIARRLDWVHMPVPIDRDDDAYFAPLDDLRLRPETQLYLGLLHKEDGVEGARRRIDTADAHRQGFGIATECGMGREPREAILGLLELHRQAASV